MFEIIITYIWLYLLMLYINYYESSNRIRNTGLRGNFIKTYCPDKIIRLLKLNSHDAESKSTSFFFTPKSPKGDLLINKDLWNPL